MATYYRSSWRLVEDLHSRTRTAVVVVNCSRACTRGNKRENYSSHCLLRIAIVRNSDHGNSKVFNTHWIRMRHESRIIVLYALRAYNTYPLSWWWIRFLRQDHPLGLYALVRMRHESRIIASYAFRAYDAYPVALVMYSLSGVRIIRRGLLFSIVFSYPGHAGPLLT